MWKKWYLFPYIKLANKKNESEGKMSSNNLLELDREQAEELVESICDRLDSWANYRMTEAEFEAMTEFMHSVGTNTLRISYLADNYHANADRQTFDHWVEYNNDEEWEISDEEKEAERNALFYWTDGHETTYVVSW
jgi:GH24 family phage-related lysozyme (muramidase)